MNGIRQGDNLSLILFNLIMNEIIKEVRTSGSGYGLGKQRIKIACYADDTVIISEDKDDLQRMLYKFETTGGRFGMMIFVQKTESLIIYEKPRVVQTSRVQLEREQGDEIQIPGDKYHK